MQSSTSRVMSRTARHRQRPTAHGLSGVSQDTPPGYASVRARRPGRPATSSCRTGLGPQDAHRR